MPINIDSAKLDKIKSAAFELASRGDKVTVRAVLAIVGGDTGTIARALKAIKSDNDQTASLGGVTLPDDLAAALIKALRAERQAGAASRQIDVDDALTDMVAAIATAKVAEAKAAESEATTAKAHNEIGRLTAHLDRAAVDLAAAQDAARIAQERAAEAESRSIRAEAAADVAARATAEQVAGLKAQLEVLTGELARAREAERVAQERAAVAEANRQTKPKATKSKPCTS